MQQIMGVIGGSGLYKIEGIEVIDEIMVDTPFGVPSDKIIKGKLEDTILYFLPRHGLGHRILPSNINYRANIYALKKLGVSWIISVSAVGSMKEEIHPGDIVIVDQFIDWTFKRNNTFFDDGIAVHISFADPLCSDLRKILYDTAKDLNYSVHKGGTYICIEGPQFSMRAESNLYRKFGVDVIGMTNMPEAKLAREAEICYATIALSTDYDCWNTVEEDVNVNSVVEVLKESAVKAKSIIKNAALRLPESKNCKCDSALQGAIITDKKFISSDLKQKYNLLMGKYL